jgi:hypothetical protein
MGRCGRVRVPAGPNLGCFGYFGTGEPDQPVPVEGTFEPLSPLAATRSPLRVPAA